MTTVSIETTEKSSSVSDVVASAPEAVDTAKTFAEEGESGARSPKSQSRKPNRVRQSRIESMLSKAELARRANLSVLTVDRIEKGFGCRMNTKRKILEALGLSLADRVRVFGEEE
jgi:DNA-binding XRE family transcriptional regulator